MSKTWLGLLGLLLPLPLLAGEGTKAPPGPTVSLLLKDRHGHAEPVRSGNTHTGGGNIEVQQPAPDTIVITLTGVAVAGDHPCHGSSATMAFELEQSFEVVFEKPEVKAAKVTLEGRVVGVLRGGRKGAAAESGGCATVAGGGAALVAVCVPDHSVSGCDSLSINDHAGPVGVPVGAGPHTLHQSWLLSATHPQALCGKSASAEFAPDPALDPTWISTREPFHGIAKKDFGFQVVVRVADETPPEPKK